MDECATDPTHDALRDAARAIFLHALAQCGVEQAFRRKIQRTGGPIPGLLIDRHRPFPLGDRFRVVAIGKAAPAMLRAVCEVLPANSQPGGILIAPACPDDLPPGFQFFAGGHPLPNQASFAGAYAALAVARRCAQTVTPCLFLISGGASAMMELPLAPGITLQDTIAFHRTLVHSGGSIAEINCVRKHFSAVKGGRLALTAGPAPILSLLVADVPLRNLDALGSGPTLPDSSTIAECRAIIARYKLAPQWPQPVKQFFASTGLPETPKPGNLQAHAVTLLSEQDLAQAAKEESQRLGFYTVVDSTCDDWDYQAAAAYLLQRLRTLRADHRRVCLIAPGEVTVQVESATGRVGVGGRNQHFALYAATLLTPADRSTVILSAGSDGIDGNSTAAGAIVDDATLTGPGDNQQRRSQQAALALAHFDSSTFLHAHAATLVTGPTGNNLRDLRILLAD